MKAASVPAFIRNSRPLLRLAAYTTVIAGAAYLVVASLGIVHASLAELVVIEKPRVQLQLRRPNMPLPPVIVPPADPRRDPRFVNWFLKREDSIITLGAPQSSTEQLLAGPLQTSDSFVTLTPLGGT